ncbi:MAG: sulfotransferase family 2 domain-containing protein [Pseudomonadota bacterium]
MYYPKEGVIFVAINKTGSSSVVTVLNKALYSHDVPEQWQKVPLHPRLLINDQLTHAHAFFYLQELGKEVYSDAYVFTQVRNPYDKVVSDFIFRCRAPKKLEKWRRQRQWFMEQGLSEPSESPGKDLFKRYVEALESGKQSPHPHWDFLSREYKLPDAGRRFLCQHDGLTDLEGNIIVDDIFRLEDMPGDWNRLQRAIEQKTGKTLLDLPHVNQSKRGRYQDYFDDVTFATVTRLFKKDLEAFDYSF